ncbi:biotin--protein ligase [Thermomonas sp.]|uniref:biotin--protein ligase n=1 Tax=Thermomonas sp. TaxID=1971895 RepID=UPI002488507C|nr:biotin--protein ligase [Thermomonas sp.]MDI1254081.1 biotin--protein ligase [Thermomonas sp.]
MHGEYKVPGGKLVVADLDVTDGRLADVRISGDFFLEPDAALDAINQALCGLPAGSSEAVLTAAVEGALDAGVSMYGITPEAVAVVVRRAVDAGTAP